MSERVEKGGGGNDGGRYGGRVELATRRSAVDGDMAGRWVEIPTSRVCGLSVAYFHRSPGVSPPKTSPSSGILCSTGQ